MITRWMPFSGFKPTWFFWSDPGRESLYIRCKLDGHDAWTNSHVLLRGEPPIPIPADHNLDPDHVAQMTLRAVSGPLMVVNPLAVAVVNEDPPLVVFDNFVAVQAKYYALIAERFPDCRWWSNHGVADRHPFVVLTGEQIEALAMPYQFWHTDELKDLLAGKAPKNGQQEFADA
jgi:hypothetical protein